MDIINSKTSYKTLSIIPLLLLGVIFLCIWGASFSYPLLAFQAARNRNVQSPPRNSTTEDELLQALEKASMPNKTVIIAVINKAYVEQTVKSDTTMLDLFLNSFWLGEETRHLVNHLLLVNVDQTAYERCVFLRLNCYKLKTDGLDFSGEKMFMSEEFIKMMWRRTLLLLEVLKHGYSFIFTDTDVMWLRNPFTRLNKNEKTDLQISTDIFNDKNSTAETANINTGFYYIRSNNRTITLFETWYARKDNATGKKEQDVLQDIVKEGKLKKLGMKVRFLRTVYYSGFCRDSEDIRKVVTVHANCCRSIIAKVTDLKTTLRDWKRFKSGVGVNISVPFRWTNHHACRISWKN